MAIKIFFSFCIFTFFSTTFQEFQAHFPQKILLTPTCVKELQEKIDKAIIPTNLTEIEFLEAITYVFNMKPIHTPFHRIYKLVAHAEANKTSPTYKHFIACDNKANFLYDQFNRLLLKFLLSYLQYGEKHTTQQHPISHIWCLSDLDTMIENTATISIHTGTEILQRLITDPLIIELYQSLKERQTISQAIRIIPST